MIQRAQMLNAISSEPTLGRYGLNSTAEEHQAFVESITDDDVNDFMDCCKSLARLERRKRFNRILSTSVLMSFMDYYRLNCGIFLAAVIHLKIAFKYDRGRRDVLLAIGDILPADVKSWRRVNSWTRPA